MVIAARAMTLEHNFSLGYESLIVPSMEYDHSFTWKYKSKAYLVPMNKLILFIIWRRVWEWNNAMQ